jgi:Cu/Zn superoxide dismutase
VVKMNKLLLASLLAMTTIGCATSGGPKAMATLSPTGGSKAAGIVRFDQSFHGEVKVQVDLTGVPPGVHSLHLLPQGACSSDASIGGYLNPTEKEGSAHQAEGLGNVTADSKGEVHARFNTRSLSIAEWVSSQSFSSTPQPDGTSLPVAYADVVPTRNSVIGQAVLLRLDADDPASGAARVSVNRIACGVVEPMSGPMMNGSRQASRSHEPPAIPLMRLWWQ